MLTNTHNWLYAERYRARVIDKNVIDKNKKIWRGNILGGNVNLKS